MDLSTSSGIVTSTLKPIAYYLFGCILNKLEKAKESNIIGVVIPASCGKTELVKQLNEINNELLFIDVETECLFDLPDTEKKIIQELKKQPVTGPNRPQAQQQTEDDNPGSDFFSGVGDFFNKVYETRPFGDRNDRSYKGLGETEVKPWE